MMTFRVRADTKCKSLAGAIAAVMREESELTLNVIGAEAVNQAVKGIAIARTYLTPFGIDVQIKPSFKTAVIEDGEKSIITIMVRRIEL